LTGGLEVPFSFAVGSEAAVVGGVEAASSGCDVADNSGVGDDLPSLPVSGFSDDIDSAMIDWSGKVIAAGVVAAIESGWDVADTSCCEDDMTSSFSPKVSDPLGNSSPSDWS
jgi:hypothetical protein